MSNIDDFLVRQVSDMRAALFYIQSMTVPKTSKRKRG